MTKAEAKRKLRSILEKRGVNAADYLERVLMRITFVGAAFLAIVAIIPSVITSSLEVNYLVAQFYGGPGLLIVVSVAMDTLFQIQSHLLAHQYEGLIKKSRLRGSRR